MLFRSTAKGEELNYKGKIDGEGKLYIDKEGNTSICISNDKYYVYKNYNSEIMIGERSKDNCNIEYDALTNKYVAFLESKGSESNVYSKDEVDNLIDGKTNELNHKIETNTNEISNIKSNIEELQTNLNNYALQSELDNNMNNLSSLITANQTNINDLNSQIKTMKTTFVNYAEGHGVASGQSISVKVNVTVSGTYLIIFGIAHCQANAIETANSFWTVSTNNGNPISRTYLNIPISTSWDNLNTATNVVYNMSAGEAVFTFTNATGSTTNSMYGTTALVYGILIS